MNVHRHLLPGRGNPRDRASRSRRRTHSFAAVKARSSRSTASTSETLIFLEDGDEPVDETRPRPRPGRPAPASRPICTAAATSRWPSTFNGETVHHRFGPGTTVARVKNWAAEHKFGMTRRRRASTSCRSPARQDRPAPGTHIGTLASCPACRSPSISSPTSASTALREGWRDRRPTSGPSRRRREGRLPPRAGGRPLAPGRHRLAARLHRRHREGRPRVRPALRLRRLPAAAADGGPVGLERERGPRLRSLAAQQAAGGSALSSAPTGRAAPRSICPATAKASPATTTGGHEMPSKIWRPADGHRPVPGACP